MILSAEDGAADTIRPRLEAAGADLSRIVVLRPGESPTIPNDLTMLEAMVGRVRAKLVIIDPLIAFVDERYNVYKDHDVRRALAPLTDLAARMRFAVLAIRHLRKTEGGPATHRGGGSIGIIGAARSGLLLAHDPRDGSRRILAPVKNNLCALPPALVFSIVPHGTSARIEWHGTRPYTADELLAELGKCREGSKLAIAEALLRRLLEKGERPEEEVRLEAKKAGIADITLRRARESLRVRVRRRGFGKDGEWILDLGEDDEKGRPRKHGKSKRGSAPSRRRRRDQSTRRRR